MKRTLTKGGRLVTEMCGDIPAEGYPVLTEAHPFLRKVIVFAEKRNEWLGTVSDLLTAIGDEYTPPNTAAKLLQNMIMTCSTNSTELMSLLPAPIENGSLLCGNGDGIFLP